VLRGSIYDFTYRYLRALGRLEGKTVVDVPAGQGFMSSEFTKLGAKVIALDLYPEKILGNVDQKLFVDMNTRFPLEDEIADIVLCQEGIEHVPNQLTLMAELNRILKPGGTLILTTPSLSHLRARVSMFLVESEYWKRLPASEVDSIWFSENQSERIYFGHFFLMTSNQLRLLATLNGFSIKSRLRTNISGSSLFLFLISYPMILISTIFAFVDSYRKNRTNWSKEKAQVYKEQVCLNISPITLLCKDMFWVLQKTNSLSESRARLKSFTR